MIQIHVFVERSDATSQEDERALRLATAAAKRFAGSVAVVEHPLDDKLAEALGVQASPTVAVNDVVLSVGRSLPAGRLLRFIQAELDE